LIQWFKIAQVLVSVILLTLALYMLDWEKIVVSIANVKPVTFAIAVMLNLITIPVLALRWHCLMREVSETSFSIHLTQYFAATFTNSFTPANIGGDIFRAFSARKTVGVPTVIAILIRERILGLMGYLFTLLTSFTIIKFGGFDIELPWNSPLGLAALISVAVFFLILLLPVLNLIFSSLLKSMNFHEKYNTILKLLELGIHFPSIKIFFLTCGLTVLGISLWVSSIFILAKDLIPTIPWLALALIASVIEIIRFIPFSIQGIGIREGGFALLVTSMGFIGENGFVLAMLAYLSLTLVMLISGIMAILSKIILANK